MKDADRDEILSVKQELREVELDLIKLIRNLRDWLGIVSIVTVGNSVSFILYAILETVK